MSSEDTSLPPEAVRERKRRGGFLRDLRGWLRGAFLDNAALKFVALILSITLFILVNTDREHQLRVDVPVSYTMPGERVPLVDLPDKVQLTVEGSWRRIKRFDVRDVDPIQVDLSGLREGEYSFDRNAVKLPPGLELRAITPAQIDLRFDERAERTLPVNVARTGRPARGYKVERVVPTPAQVTVSGARTFVEELTGLRTRELDLTDRRESFTQRVALVKPDRYVDIVGPSEVEVAVELQEEQMTRSFTVAVQPRPATGAVSKDAIKPFATEPREVTLVLQGPQLLLERIQADALQPYVEIFQDDVAHFDPRPALVAVDLPEGVRHNITPTRVKLVRR